MEYRLIHSRCIVYILVLPMYTFIKRPCFRDSLNNSVLTSVIVERSKWFLSNPPRQHWGRWPYGWYLLMVWIYHAGWKVIVLTCSDWVACILYQVNSSHGFQKRNIILLETFATFKPLWKRVGCSPDIWSHFAYSRCVNMNDIQYAT